MRAYQQHKTGLDIDALIENHRVGYSLERDFYLSPEIFEEVSVRWSSFRALSSAKRCSSRRMICYRSHQPI